MRIAIFTNTYAPYVNGVAISVANLCAGLLGREHEVNIFAPALPDYDYSRLDPEGVFRFPAFQPPGWITQAKYPLALPWSADVWAQLRHGGYDLVHTQHPWHVGSWAEMYSRVWNVPEVSTAHSQNEVFKKQIALPDPWLVWWMRQKARRHYNRATLVTTPGEGCRQYLINNLGISPDKVLTVSNATKLAPFWNADGDRIRWREQIDEDEFVLGYVGRISPEKNLGILLDAFRQILAVQPNTKLLIVGGSDDECKVLRAQASALGIPEDRLVLAGYIDHGKIAEYYAAMDLFITPSFSEVQPMSFAEALATMPIIAFDVPGCNDMIASSVNGILVELSQGAGGLARAALQLICDRPALRRMSQGARKWSARYDQFVAVEAMIAAYEMAIDIYRHRRRFFFFRAA